jgi:mono/diheme cytochrome c family protein
MADFRELLGRIRHASTQCLVGLTALLPGLTLPIASLSADVSYNDIAPILSSRCVMCHQGPAAPLELRLDSLDGVKAGSKNGPVVVSSDPQSSELIKRLKGTSQPRMPMTGPPFLADHEIALFEQWIARGMQPGSAQTSTSEPEPASPAEPAAQPAGPVTYQQVAVIFATRCAKCHTENGLMGPAPEGYRLTSYGDTVSAADRVRVVPGNPAASELMRRIVGQARPRMPFDGPPYLSEREIDLIEQWISDGARDASGSPAPSATGRRIRLHGTLDHAGRLDGLELTISSETRVDDRPQAGDYVQVRGTIGKNGNVDVERIRER